MKLNNIFKYLNPKNLFKRVQPISGGNSYETHVQLEQQVQLDISTMVDSAEVVKQNLTGLGKLNERFRGENYELWRLMLQEMNYFTNRWPVMVGSETLQNNIMLATKIAFLYGKSCIARVGNRFIACYIQQAELNWDGTYSKLILRPATLVFTKNSTNPQQVEKPQFTREDTKWVIKNTPENPTRIQDDVAMYEWDTLASSGWFRLLPYLNQKESLLKLFNVNRYPFFKNLNYNVDDPSTFDDEMECFFDDNTPFKLSAGMTTGISNRFSVDEAKGKIQGGTLEIVQYMEYWKKTWYEILGKRTNLDQKRERVITSEVETSQSFMDALESDEYIHYMMFLKAVNRITGIELAIIKDKEVKQIRYNTMEWDEDEDII